MSPVGGSLTITNSYFSGSGGILSVGTRGAGSGGLVGASRTSVFMMTNSYFSGSSGIFSFPGSVSGGLVGYTGGPLPARMGTSTIMKSYYSGSGEIYSDGASGGLVGNSSGTSLTIMECTFSGSGGIFTTFSGSGGTGATYGVSGGLVGSIATLTIINSYWNTDAPQSVDGSPQSPKRANGDAAMNPSGATGLTFTQLMGVSGIYPNGLPHSATDNTKAWDLGTNTQLPSIKLCIPTVTGTGATATTNWATCASYGDLLAGQR